MSGPIRHIVMWRLRGETAVCALRLVRPQPAKGGSARRTDAEGRGMIAQSRAIMMGALLSFICQTSPAVARSSAGTADHPWNVEHINQLPAEVRNAISRLCGPSLRAAHYFATYSENSRLLNLHFEHSQCRSQKVCTQAGSIRSMFWTEVTIDF
jgi:hypothetical protein